MEYSIAEVQQHFHSNTILIGAQVYLDKFYRNLGFIPEGYIYLEDNIPHIKMKYQKP